jgi:hypothetical protein
MHGTKTIPGEEAESGQTMVDLESSAGDKQKEVAETVTGTKPAGTMAGSTRSARRTSGRVPIACKNYNRRQQNLADSDNSEVAGRKLDPQIDRELPG